MTELETIRAILDLARWAPSGDNTQPWRFEIRSRDHVLVHAFDTREHCIYDLDGHSSQLAVGAMLETLRIAATQHGLRVTVTRRVEAPDTRPVFDAHFARDDTLRPDRLAGFIRTRTVQRRALRTRGLTVAEKAELEASLPPGYRIHWIEGVAGRWRTARLMWRNAHLRLTLPEAYEVHRRIIEWGARYSEDRIPEQALGVNRLTARVMRYAMQSWERVAFFNRWLGGTIGPRIELDLIPSLACAAHFALLPNSEPSGLDDYVAAGRAVQRFWLTACALGLQLQPEMTPLIFARYANCGRAFSCAPRAGQSAQDIAKRLRSLLGGDRIPVFMGRIGAGQTAEARSLRRPLDTLIRGGAP